jgi:hypothetical protein
VDSGLWTVDCRLSTIHYGQWTVDYGLCTINSGLWTVDSGLLTVDYGLCTINSGLSTLNPQTTRITITIPKMIKAIPDNVLIHWI